MQLNPHQYNNVPYEYIKHGPSRILGNPRQPFPSQGPYSRTGCIACDQAHGNYSPFYSSPSHLSSHTISRDRLTPKYAQKVAYVTSGQHVQQKQLLIQPCMQSVPFQAQRRVSYQPYMRKYIQYQEYIQYVPVERSEWKYQKVMKQIDFVPKQYYQTKIQYYPKQRINQKVRWIPVEQQIVHVPQDVLAQERNMLSINRNLKEVTNNFVNRNIAVVNSSFNTGNVDTNQVKEQNQILQ